MSSDSKSSRLFRSASQSADGSEIEQIITDGPKAMSDRESVDNFSDKQQFDENVAGEMAIDDALYFRYIVDQENEQTLKLKHFQLLEGIKVNIENQDTIPRVCTISKQALIDSLLKSEELGQISNIKYYNGEEQCWKIFPSILKLQQGNNFILNRLEISTQISRQFRWEIDLKIRQNQNLFQNNDQNAFSDSTTKNNLIFNNSSPDTRLSKLELLMKQFGQTILQEYGNISNQEWNPNSPNLQLMSSSQFELGPSFSSLKPTLSQMTLFTQSVDLIYLFSNPICEPDGEEQRKTSQLDIQYELKMIKDALKNRKIESMAASKDNLLYALNRGSLILHISCHGSRTHLEWENHENQNICDIYNFSQEELTNILPYYNAKKNHPLIVFISACHSENFGKAFKKKCFPFVIAVKESEQLLDKFGIYFAAVFYQSLTFLNKSVKSTFKHVLKQADLFKDFGKHKCCCRHPHTPKWDPNKKDKCYMIYYHHQSDCCDKFKNQPLFDEKKCNFCLQDTFKLHNLDCKFLDEVRKAECCQLQERNKIIIVTIEDKELNPKIDRDEHRSNENFVQNNRLTFTESVANEDKVRVNFYDLFIQNYDYDNLYFRQKEIKKIITSFLNKRDKSYRKYRVLNLCGNTNLGKEDIVNFSCKYLFERKHNTNVEGIFYIKVIISEFKIQFAQMLQMITNAANYKNVEFLHYKIPDKQFVFILDFGNQEKSEKLDFIFEFIKNAIICRNNIKFVIITQDIIHNCPEFQQTIDIKEFDFDIAKNIIFRRCVQQSLTKEKAKLINDEISNILQYLKPLTTKNIIQHFEYLKTVKQSEHLQELKKLFQKLKNQQNDEIQSYQEQANNSIIIEYEQLNKSNIMQLIKFLCQMPSGLWIEELQIAATIIGLNNWKDFLINISEKLQPMFVDVKLAKEERKTLIFDSIYENDECIRLTPKQIAKDLIKQKIIDENQELYYLSIRLKYLTYHSRCLLNQIFKEGSFRSLREHLFLMTSAYNYGIWQQTPVIQEFFKQFDFKTKDTLENTVSNYKEKYETMFSDILNEVIKTDAEWKNNNKDFIMELAINSFSLQLECKYKKSEIPDLRNIFPEMTFKIQIIKAFIHGSLLSGNVQKNILKRIKMELAIFTMLIQYSCIKQSRYY